MATLSAPSDVPISRASVAYGVVGLIEKEALQPVEMVQASMLDELGPESVHDSVEHRERPAPLEDPLRRLVVRRLALIPIFAGRDFEGQHLASAAFLRATAIGFVGEEEFQGGQDERPEPPLFRVGAIEISAFHHADEELLREILRLVRRIPAAANIGV